MESFQRCEAIAAPLMRINVDTDQIIPTRFLARSSDDGLGAGLFAEWRFDADGQPRPDFVLNQPPWNRAEILVAGRNFGCGSSREAAPRALRQNGIRAVIAPSFGEIFYGNCFRNGVAPVVLDEDVVQAIAAQLVADPAAATVAVDLEHQQVRGPRGDVWAFHTPARLRRMLLQGLDEIALTLEESARISGFRAADAARRPWAYPAGAAR